MTNLKKTLLVGTALVAVGGFAITATTSAFAAQDEKTTAGSVDWDVLADATEFDNETTSDTLKYGAVDNITVDDAQGIGAIDGVSVDINDQNGASLIFTSSDVDGSDNTGSVVFGDIVDTADDATPGDNTFTITLGTNGATGVNVSFYGDVGDGDATYNAVVAGGNTAINVLTLGNGTDAMDFSATLDVMENAAGTTVLNLEEGATVSGALSDSAAGTVTINVNGNATLSGDGSDLAHTNADIDVDDGVVLTLLEDITIGTGTLTLGSTTGVDAELKLNHANAAFTGNIEGEVAGQGKINVDLDGAITGGIGETTGIEEIDIAADATLTITSDADGIEIDATTIKINDAEDDDGLTLDTSGTDQDITVTGAVVNNSGTDAKGLVTVANAGTITFSQDLGASDTASLAKLAWTNGDATEVEAKGDIYVADIDIDQAAGTLTLNGAAAQVVEGTIDALDTADEGIIKVLNTSGGVTFEGKIGADQQVGDLQIGSATQASTATFEETVDVEDFSVDATAGDSTATFEKSLEIDGAGALIDGGDADGEDALVTVAGDLIATTAGTSKIALGDNTGSATLTLNGTAAQDVSVIIDAQADGEGTLNITNTGTVAFQDDVGVTDLKAIDIAAGATVDVGDDGGSDVDTFDAKTITLGSGSTLKLKDSGGTELKVTGDIVGAADGDGTLTVAAAATLDGDIGGAAATAGNAVGTVNVEDNVTFTIQPSADVIINASKLVLKDDDGTADATDSILALDPANGAITVAGDITTEVTEDNSITIADDAANAVTFEGNIGTSALKLDDISFSTSGNAQDVVFEGNVYTKTITGEDEDTFIFNGTSAQSVSGDITDGKVEIGDGTNASNVTFAGTLSSMDTLLVEDKATAKFMDDATFTGAFTNDGTLTVAQGKTLTVASLADGAKEGTLKLILGTTAAGADDSATVATAGAFDFEDFDGDGTSDSMKIYAVKGSGVIEDGEEFLAFDGDTDNNGDTLTTAPAADGVAVENDFALFDIYALAGDDALVTVVTADGDDIVLEARKVDTTTVTATTNNSKAADAVLSVTDAEYAADADLAAVYDSVAGATTAQIDERVEAVQATVDGGNVVGALMVNNTTSGITNARMASLENGNVISGMAAGNMSEGLGAWGQVFGTTGEQDKRDGVDGYDVDTVGFAIGIDSQNIAENTTLGLAFSYADTDVDSKNANRTKTEVDTYQVSLYGSHNWDSRTRVLGQVAYASSDNDTTRHDVGGVAGLDAKGNFDADVWAVNAKVERDYEVNYNTVVTPSVLANYMHYSPDSYTETGAGGANLVVNQDDISLFELGVGVDVAWNLEQADGSHMVPELRVGYRHDLIGDEYAASSRLSGSTATFQTKGFDPAQGTFNLGAGVTYFSTTNWELTANYDYEVKSDYDAHNGQLRAAYKFQDL